MRFKCPSLLAAALVAGGPLYGQEAAGDPANGQIAFAQCSGCHSTQEGRPGAGPHLAGLMGRQIGSVEDFRYSDALIQEDRAWDAGLLSAYLTDPRGTIPGSRKTHVLRDSTTAADVIAYLASLSE